MRPMAGKATPATRALERSGVDFTLHEYPVPAGDDLSYGEAVAAALGVDPARVYKTLVATVDGSEVVAVVPVTTHLSLKRLARARNGKKAAMADPAAAERLTGYVTGGISPFGQRRRLPFVVDATLEWHGAVLVSGGRRGIQVEVAPQDLIRLTGAGVAVLTG